MIELPKYNHTKGKAVRSHEQRRAIQDSDAALTAAQKAQTADELAKALRAKQNDQ